MNMFRFAARFLIAFALAIPSAQAQTPQSYNTVASIAALKAMTNRPQVVQVTGTNAGIFNLFPGACSSANDLTQVQPTSGTTVCYVRAQSAYNVGQPAFMTPEQFNASAGTGGDDTATFAGIFAAGKNVQATPGKTYRLNGLVMNGNIINCGGLGGTQAGASGLSLLMTGNAVSPAGPAIIMKGWGSQIVGCGLGDPNDYSMVSTTLASGASGGATSVVVTSAANLSVGRLLFITLDNGIVWPIKIASFSGGGTTVNFVSGDTLPSAATAGNVVRTAAGVVRIDSSPSSGSTPNSTIFTQIRDSVFNAQPIAIELVNTDADPVGNLAFNKQGSISNVQTFYTKLAGIWMSADVENYQITDSRLYGFFPNDSAAAFIQDSRGSVLAHGGHFVSNVLGIQAMADFILKGANLSRYTGIDSDSPNGIFVSQGSQWLTFTGVFTGAQNGTNGQPTVGGGYGIKVSANSAFIGVSNWTAYTGGSAVSLWVESGAILSVDASSWIGNQSMGGSGDYVGGGRPMFLVQRTSPQTVSSGSSTKVQFDDVVQDASSAWDGTNYRWVPKAAGWYNVSLNVTYVATTPNTGTFGNIAYIAVNGVQGPTASFNYAPPGNGYVSINIPKTKLYLNGSTDYIEGFVDFTGTTPQVNGASAGPFRASWFEAEYIGP